MWKCYFSDQQIRTIGRLFVKSFLSQNENGEECKEDPFWNEACISMFCAALFETSRPESIEELMEDLASKVTQITNNQINNPDNPYLNGCQIMPEKTRTTVGMCLSIWVSDQRSAMVLADAIMRACVQDEFTVRNFSRDTKKTNRSFQVNDDINDRLREMYGQYGQYNNNVIFNQLLDDALTLYGF